MVEFIRADIQRRADDYQGCVDKWARGGGFPVSFIALERNRTKGKPQPFPYWDGVLAHDARHIEPHGAHSTRFGH